MAKAALKTMTKSLAKDLGPEIRVNGVSPGAILWSGALERDDDPGVEQGRLKLLESIPLKRLGKPEDIAHMVYFLATTASYTSGQVIKVDGGRSLI
jgi:pteridine reductase